MAIPNDPWLRLDSLLARSNFNSAEPPDYDTIFDSIFGELRSSYDRIGADVPGVTRVASATLPPPLNISPIPAAPMPRPRPPEAPGADFSIFGDEGDAAPPEGAADAMDFGAFGQADPKATDPIEVAGTELDDVPWHHDLTVKNVSQNVAETAKGVIPGGIQAGGSVLTGLGGLATGFNRAQTDVLDRIDRGETVPETEDPIGYQHMTPEQRRAVRAEIDQQLATPVQDNPLFKAGKAVKEFGQDLIPAAPGYKTSTGRQIGEGLGSMVGGAAASLVGGPVAGGAAFALMGAGEAVERAVGAGATPDQIVQAAKAGILPGLTDSAPIELLLGRYQLPVPMVGPALKAAGKIGWTALLEGLQEGGQQWLQNLIAREIYAPNQELTEDVASNAGIGAAVGGIAEGGKQAVTALLGRRGGRSGARPGVTDDVEVPAPEPTEVTPEEVMQQAVEPAEGPEPSSQPEPPSPPETPPVADEIAPGEAPSTPPQIPPEDYALLRGAGYTPQQVRELNDTERQALLEEARENGIAPIDAAQAEEELSGLAGAEPADFGAFGTVSGQELDNNSVATQDGIENQPKDVSEQEESVVSEPSQTSPETGEIVPTSAQEESRAPEGDGSRTNPVRAERPEDIDVAAERVNVDPSEAQKEAGNYQKGHVVIDGLNISIETPAGAKRTGTDPNGKAWETTMPGHYGYIKRTRGGEGEQMDVYVGPKGSTKKAFVIDQIDPVTGRFDEHKVVLGVASEKEARDLYQDSFSDGSGPRRLGAIAQVSIPTLRGWLQHGNPKKPFAQPRRQTLDKVDAILQGRTVGKDKIAPRDLRKVAKVIRSKPDPLAIAAKLEEMGFDVDFYNEKRAEKQAQAKREAEAKAKAARDRRELAEAKKNAPKSLLAYIAERGGLRPDPGGELRNMGVTGITRAGGKPLLRKNGATLDELVEWLREGGFMDEAPSDQVEDSGTQRAALDLIAEELRGNKVFPIAQQAEAAEIQRREEEQAEIDNLARRAFVEMGADADAEPALFEELKERIRRGEDPENALEALIIQAELSDPDGSRRIMEDPEEIPGFDDDKDEPGIPPEAREAAPEGRGEGEGPAEGGSAPEPGEGVRGAGEGGRSGTDRNGEAPDETPLASTFRPTPTTEQTEAGEQTVLPGAERISDGQLAQRRADQPLKPSAAQKPLDFGLFGDEDKQGSLFSLGRRALPRDNYRKNLSEYAPVLYRETDIESALEFVPSSWGIQAPMGEIFVADSRDLAIGQHSNKGVLLEFDSDAFDGRINTKPGWEVTWESGQAEFIAQHDPRSTKSKVQALRAIEVYPTARGSRGAVVRLKRALAELEAQGWTKEILGDGAVRYERPSVADALASTGDPILDRIHAEIQKFIESDSDYVAAFKESAWPVIEQISYEAQRILGPEIGRNIIFSPDLGIASEQTPGYEGSTAEHQLYGLYRWGKRVIYLSMNHETTALSTFYHEAWHDLERRLPNEDIAILRDATDTLRENVRNYHTQVHIGPNEADRLADFEVRAEAFRAFMHGRGGPLPGPVRRLFSRLRLFFNRVRNFIRGRGFRTVEDIFTEAAEGRLADTAINPDHRYFPDGLYAIGPRLTPPHQPPVRQQQVPPPIVQVPDQRTGREVFFDRAAMRLHDRLRTALRQAGRTWRRHWQDYFIDLYRIEEQIARAIGAAHNRLPAGLSAYDAQELAHGRTNARIEDIHEHFVQPILDLMKKEKLSVDDVNEWLYAKHARDRNAVIARRDPTRPDGGSGMTNAQAAASIARLTQEGKAAALDKVADKVYKMLRQALERRVAYGLITQQYAQDLRNVFGDKYVPLKGWEADPEGDWESSAGSLGRGYDVRGAEFQSAFGRSSLADSPLAYAVLQAQEAVVRGEKNRVLQRMMRLVQSFPNKDLWEVDPKETVKDLDPLTGTVVTSQRAVTQGPNIVHVKVGGKTHYIAIYHRGLADAMQNVGVGEVARILRPIAKFTRAYAALQTTWNPEFFITNFLRDLQEAGITLAADERGKMYSNFMKSLPAAMRASFHGVMQTGNAPGPWQKLWDDYRNHGGKITYADLNTIYDLKRYIETEIDPQGLTEYAAKAGRETIGRLLSGFGAMSDIFENATRLAAFKAARDLGMPPEQAAHLARGVTLNFTRRGKYGQALNSLYAFANVSIQGATKMFRLMARSPWVRRAMFTYITASFLATLWNLSVAGDDDEDGRNRYAKMQPWERERNQVIFIPGQDQPIKIPIALSLVPFHAIGEQVGMLFGGHVWNIKGAKLKPAEVFANLAGTWVQAFNPLGASGRDPAQLILSGVSPTITDPVVEQALNRNWLGLPIHPDKPNFPSQRRQWMPSEESFSSTSDIAKSAARGLNKALGGNEYTPARVLGEELPIYPDSLEYMWNYVLGGFGRTLLNSYEFGANLGSGVVTEPERTPLLRRLYGTNYRRSDEVSYYKMKQDVERRFGDFERIDRLMQQRREKGEEIPEGAKEARDAARKSIGGYLGARGGYRSQVWDEISEAEKEIKKLRAEIRKANDDKAMTRAERQKRVNEIREQIRDRMNRVRLRAEARTGEEY